MPIPEELFDSIGNSHIFTIVDQKQGFNQIVLVAKDRKKQHSVEVTSCGNGL